MMNYFPSCQLFPTQASLYFHDIVHLHSLLSPVQTFTSRTRHDMYTVSPYHHSFPISLVWKKLHSDRSFSRTDTLLNKLLSGCFIHHCNINFLKSRETLIYPISSHNIQFLSSRFTHLKQTHSGIILLE